MGPNPAAPGIRASDCGSNCGEIDRHCFYFAKNERQIMRWPKRWWGSELTWRP
jgi:hypothetical protein